MLDENHLIIHAVIRWAVARNISTPPEILTVLAGDLAWLIRFAVASNLSTPPEMLDALARDEDEEVRKAAVNNHKRVIKEW